MSLHRHLLIVALVCLVWGQPPSTAEALPGRAGEVLVVANSADAASMEIAEAYCRRRSLPPANLLALPFESPIKLAAGQFRETLMDPLLARWERLDPHPRYIVLVRGVPYRTGGQSTTAGILFNSLDRQPIPHGYYGAPTAFDPDVPWQGKRLRQATMVTGYTVADSLALIERSDAQYRIRRLAGPFVFCRGQGPRGIRNRQADEVVEALRQEGMRAEYVAEPEVRDRRRMMGYFTGRQRVHIASNSFAKGALAGNLTSFGGYLLDGGGQTSILSFIQYGAAGSYGTVVEPTNIFTRWPHYALTLDYVRGATVADAYLRHLMDPSLGVVVGDPLCAPFARPPAVDIAFPDELADLDDLPPVSLEVVEGADGVGLSRVELWLDDRLSLFEWQPMVPARTDCRLSVGVPMRDGFRRYVRLEEETPIGDVLRKLRGKDENTVVDAAGRFRDRLVVHVPNPQDAKGPIMASLVLDGPERSVRMTEDVKPSQQLVAASAFSLGEKPPSEGDAVTVGYGGEERTVTAERGESLTAFARRVAQTVGAVAQADQGTRRVQVQAVSAEEAKRLGSELLPGLWVHVVDSEVPIQTKLPLEMAVRHAEGSAFAQGTTGPVRRLLTARGGAWTVLRPVWPAAAVRKEIPIPGWSLKPGTHVLTCVAESADGGLRIERQVFHVGAPAQRPQIEVSHKRVQVGDAIRIRSVVAEGLPEGATPVLFVNGRALRDVPWNNGVAQLSCRIPHVPPGPNRVHVEWVKEGEEAEAPDRPTINLRSPQGEFFVRRPLDYKAQFAPRTLTTAPDAEITVTGPYLHEQVRLEVNGDELPMRRDSHHGQRWHVSVSALAPGEYRLRLVSSNADDQGAVLEDPLVIQPPAGD